MNETMAGGSVSLLEEWHFRPSTVYYCEVYGRNARLVQCSEINPSNQPYQLLKGEKLHNNRNPCRKSIGQNKAPSHNTHSQQTRTIHHPQPETMYLQKPTVKYQLGCVQGRPEVTSLKKGRIWRWMNFQPPGPWPVVGGF